MGVCTIGLRKVWNADSYGMRECDQGEMCDLKKKWATVDIYRTPCFSTILSVIMCRDKYISVLFFKCEWI